MVGIWKATSFALGSVLATVLMAGLTAWLTFGTEHPTREEVRLMISETAPYLHDKQFILAELNSTKVLVSGMEKRMDQVHTIQTKGMALMEAVLMDVRELKQDIRKNRGKDQERNENKNSSAPAPEKAR